MTNEEYIKTININGTEIKLGLDDYGQQYFIEWEENGEKKETGLGAYNSSYIFDILYMFDPEYRRIVKDAMNGVNLSEEDLDKFISYVDLISEEYKESSEE